MEFVNVNVLGKEFSLKINEINFEYKKNTLQEINGELKETSSRILSRFGKLTKMSTYYPDGRLKDVTTFLDTGKKKMPAKIAVQDPSVQKSILTTKYDDKNRLIKMETSEGDYEEYTYFDDTDKIQECHTKYDDTDTLEIYNTDGVVVKSSIRKNLYDSYFEFDDQRRLIGYQVENMKRTKSLHSEETINVKIENIIYNEDDPEQLDIDVVNEQMIKFVNGKVVHQYSIVKDNDSDDRRVDESKYEYDQDNNLIKTTVMVKTISGNITKIISNTIFTIIKETLVNGEELFVTRMKNKEFDNIVTETKINKDYGYIEKHYNYNGTLIEQTIVVENDDRKIEYKKVKEGYIAARYENKNSNEFSVTVYSEMGRFDISDEYPLEKYMSECEIHDDKTDLKFEINNASLSYKAYSEDTKETPISSLKISSIGSINMDFLNIRNVISSYIAENYKSELKEIEEVIKNYKFDF